MSLLVVGSVALDSVETPFGKADNVIGGSGTFFSASASHLSPVQLVGIVGQDYPVEKLEPLRARGVDLAGLEHSEGLSFRWRGRYRHDLNSAETLETHLGVFSQFRPKIPQQFRSAPYVFLANIDPRLQLSVLEQVDRPSTSPPARSPAARSTSTPCPSTTGTCASPPPRSTPPASPSSRPPRRAR